MDQEIPPGVTQEEPVRKHHLWYLVAALLVVVVALGSLFYLAQPNKLSAPSEEAALEELPIDRVTYVNERFGIALNYPKDFCLSVWIAEPEASAPKEFPPGAMVSTWAGNMHYTDEGNTRPLNGELTAGSVCLRTTGSMTLNLRDKNINPEPFDARGEERETASLFMTNEEIALEARKLERASIGEVTTNLALAEDVTGSMSGSKILLRSVIETASGKALVLATHDYFSMDKVGETIVYYFHTFSASGDLVTGQYPTRIRTEESRTVTKESVLAREDWKSFLQTVASFKMNTTASE